MSAGLHIEGDWPSQVVIRKGWSKVIARPWNDEENEVAIRLVRGPHTFLAVAATHLTKLTGSNVYSPALYPSATGVWVKAGFKPHIELKIMERPLLGPIGEARHTVDFDRHPDLNELAEVDAAAFEGFWRMGAVGLEEAMSATSSSAILCARFKELVVGFSIVGAQMGTSFLQRVAVLPDYQGREYGAALVIASADWALKKGAVSMNLNVRGENHRAIRLYRQLGFALLDERLHVLRFGS